MSVARTPWICRQCLRRLNTISTLPRRRIRFASTASSTEEADTLSPALLSKARATANEHSQLLQKLSTTFDGAAAKRVGELTPITQALEEYDTASTSFHELRTLLRDPSTDAELRELAHSDLPSAITTLTRAQRALTAALVPAHPFAHLPCLLEIRPGIGGSEAALFAADLLRMYTSYCARTGMRVSLLKYEDAAGGAGDADAPLQEAILEVGARGAYGALRCEAGVHRVQRVPATEAKGRTHTSAASVLVLPAFPDDGGEADFEDPSSDYYVSPADVKIDVMRSSGAGGQHVNTTDSAVRLTHVPSGTVVSCQSERSQLKNRAKAWKVLRARLAQAKREKREEERLALRRTSGAKSNLGRSDKVRTYNWGQARVTDHRSGCTVNRLMDVMEGGEALEEVMESVRGWMVDREVEGMLAESQEEKSS